MSYYHLAAAVFYTNTAVVGVRLWGIHMLCVCGVEVFPMVNFRPIDSGYLCKYCIIRLIVGTVQGDYHPLIQVYMSEGIATSLAGPHRGLSPLGYSVSLQVL